MAKMSPPPMKKSSVKVDIEKAVSKAKPTAATEQTPPDATKPLQLKIPESKRNEFKAYAAMRGKAMNELFLEMFEKYKNEDV